MRAKGAGADTPPQRTPTDRQRATHPPSCARQPIVPSRPPRILTHPRVSCVYRVPAGVLFGVFFFYPALVLVNFLVWHEKDIHNVAGGAWEGR